MTEKMIHVRLGADVHRALKIKAARARTTIQRLVATTIARLVLRARLPGRRAP